MRLPSYFSIFIIGTLSIATILNAQEVRPPFDVNTVIEQVSKNHDAFHPEMSLREAKRSLRKQGNNLFPYVSNNEIATLSHFSTGLARNDNRTAFSRTGEFLLDTNVVYVPDPNSQTYPAIVFDGTYYFVVWQDSRNSTGYSDIFGARITPSGVVLDPAGIMISNAPDNQYYPAVAFDGANYLVVWEDWRGSSIDIYGARITQSGVVLDPDGFVISTETLGQYSPSVAFDGVNYLVVWQDYRSGAYDIYGTRVTQTGIVLDTAGIIISNPDSGQGHVSIAFDGTNYLVVWEDWRNGSPDIYGSRVTTSGLVLEPSGIPISTGSNSQQCPSVAFDGLNYMVVWYDSRLSFYDIFGCRINTSGVVLDPTGIAISTASNVQIYPKITFDSANYFVIWQDSREGFYSKIYGARVDTSGIVLDPLGIALSHTPNHQNFPSIAFDGTNYFAVWQDKRRGTDADIFGTRVSREGGVLDSAGIAVSTSAYHQYYPSMAFDGSNYFVVWQDLRDDSSNIYGARVDSSGNLLDPMAIVISAENLGQYQPAIAFDGLNYLVVWQDRRSGYSNIYGARVSQTGAVLDSTGIAICTMSAYNHYPSVAFDGVNYLVVCESDDVGIHEIYGARITPSGVVLDPAGLHISLTPGWHYYPSVAFDGSNYLVVWQTNSFGPLGNDICGTRVTPEGIVLDTAGIPICSAGDEQGYPSVTFGNTNYLVVWEDGRNNTYSDIYGARVSASGLVLDTSGFAISIAPYWQSSASATFDGINYLVVWQDYRSGRSYNIYGAGVSQTGVVIDSFTVSIQSGNQVMPVLVDGAGERVLIAYSAWTDYINNHPANAMRIWGKFYPFTSIKEDAGYRIQDAGLGLQIYPNPFSKKLDIRWRIADRRLQITDRQLSAIGNQPSVSLKIYDAGGRLVRQWDYQTIRLSDQILWHGDDNFGRKLPSGIYFCELAAGNHRLTKKMILCR